MLPVSSMHAMPTWPTPSMAYLPPSLPALYLLSHGGQRGEGLYHHHLFPLCLPEFLPTACLACLPSCTCDLCLLCRFHVVTCPLQIGGDNSEFYHASAFCCTKPPFIIHSPHWKPHSSFSSGFPESKSEKFNNYSNSNNSNPIISSVIHLIHSSI